MPKTATPNESRVNREYKSSIFTMLFSDKKELLELYNAVNDTTYTDPELLEINTLENAIYMGIKNDVSFLIAFRLYLYEHQSTWNPNMPLRDLLYVADEYSALTEGKNLYGKKMVKIPAPHFLVFYNGEDECPDRVVLKLSDMYQKKEEHPSLELEVIVLNVNIGHNEKLPEACKTLHDYAEYTDRVRKYAKVLPLRAAVERAVMECIREGILEEFLRRNRAEAMKVSIYEYDAQKHIRMEREEAKEEGYREGQAMLLQIIRKKLEKGKSIAQIAEELEQEEKTVKELIHKHQMDADD